MFEKYLCIYANTERIGYDTVGLKTLRQKGKENIRYVFAYTRMLVHFCRFY